MENYKQSKKARYAASVIYLMVLAFLVIGTLLSKDNKLEASSQQEKQAVIK
ncbi:MAG: hypothetical protein PHH59_05680 [Methylovulum sp.]|uniref:hypothetical protein n=1 Tax=Methylovulum sp. TaxID=1916980 RepID=UPI002625188B|nr:hypothetical protein [Methylovulum sp.]MDD2723502.1 hypothetical protein [Methylovulum sp.]MDD5124544.1 hypothetical protein [Methylovulum sp.]